MISPYCFDRTLLTYTYTYMCVRGIEYFTSGLTLPQFITLRLSLIKQSANTRWLPGFGTFSACRKENKENFFPEAIYVHLYDKEQVLPCSRNVSSELFAFHHTNLQRFRKHWFDVMRTWKSMTCFRSFQIDIDYKKKF